MNRREDQVEFACQGSVRHPKFDHHPRIQEMLNEARRGIRPYYSASRALVEQDWQDIALDLDTTETPHHVSQ